MNIENNANYTVCHVKLGLLLTYGLATCHACYSPATRRLRDGYSPSIYMCGSPKTRRYLLNKSSSLTR